MNILWGENTQKKYIGPLKSPKKFNGLRTVRVTHFQLARIELEERKINN